MLLKCYHHLHLLFENATIKQGVDENFNLDIFEMIINTNELINELANMEPLIFKMF